MRKKTQWTVSEPDMIDVYNIVSSLGEEYGFRVQFHCEFRPDYFEVIGRAYKPVAVGQEVLHFQALSKKPLRRAVNPATQMFTVAWDLYCQASGGGATAAQRGAPAGWDGRPAKRG